jgi:hypothetical protein
MARGANIGQQQGEHHMWARRIAGLLLAVCGAGVVGFLFYQSIDGRLQGPAFYALGMPGALLVGMVALIVLAYGGHLMASPRSTSGGDDELSAARRHRLSQDT